VSREQVDEVVAAGKGARLMRAVAGQDSARGHRYTLSWSDGP
jgi:hypothetical protein